MPYALMFPLNPDEADGLPRYPGRALHAIFYQWLALGDYAVSTEVHESNGPRPFTTSPVYRVDGQPRFRFTLLDDDLWPTLSQGIAKTPTIEVLGQALTIPGYGPTIRHRTYADLAMDTRIDTRIRLRFLSPTSFRSHGMHYPLPDPQIVYQSWLTQWNTFAPEDLRINVALLDIAAAHVAVGQFNIATRLVDLGANWKVVGFVGEVKYNVLQTHKIGEEWLQRLNLLADYAEFCGTGHKTTQGLGQTQRRK